jgi:hypothetical protein
MAPKLRIILRVAGLVLLVVAFTRLMIGAARTVQTQEEATREGGYVIQHRIEIPGSTLPIGLAGAFLFAASFVRMQKKI